MNLHEFLASVLTLDSTAKRWLSRTNNGTTDAYQEHLQSVALGTFEEYHAEAMMAAMDDAWLHGIGIFTIDEEGVRHIPFDEYHGGAE